MIRQLREELNGERKARETVETKMENMQRTIDQLWAQVYGAVKSPVIRPRGATLSGGDEMSPTIRAPVPRIELSSQRQADTAVQAQKTRDGPMPDSSDLHSEEALMSSEPREARENEDSSSLTSEDKTTPRKRSRLAIGSRPPPPNTSMMAVVGGLECAVDGTSDHPSDVPDSALPSLP